MDGAGRRPCANVHETPGRFAIVLQLLLGIADANLQLIGLRQLDDGVGDGLAGCQLKCGSGVRPMARIQIGAIDGLHAQNIRCRWEVLYGERSVRRGSCRA